MDFSGLPVEIISRICRFIGLQSMKVLGGTALIKVQNRDFQSLRGTCRELHHKTAYDAAIRYGPILEELSIFLEYKSLIQLLHISSIPAFRDKILYLSLFNWEVRESDAIEDDEEDGRRRIEHEERYVLDDEADSYRNSAEAVLLLAQCFRNLDGATSLERIDICSNRGQDTVLQALRIAQFSKKLAYLAVEPNHLAQTGYGAFSTTPEDFECYVKGLHIQFAPYGEDIGPRDISDRRSEENPWGLHRKDYKPNSEGLTKIISTLVNIDELCLSGCNSHPEIRLCHGCDYLFARNLAPLLLPSLSSLTVASILISGSRLRRFIKRHANSLSEVAIRFATLTDGSWRSIAQGLAKLPHLQELSLGSLRQKRAVIACATSMTRPLQYIPTNAVGLGVAPHVQHFLSVFISTFSTVSYTNGARFRRLPPKYFHVKLFQLPDVTRSPHESRAIAIVQKYAKAEEDP